MPSLAYTPPERLPGMQRRVDEGAEEAGRRPEEIRRVYNVDGAIGPEGEGLLEGPASKLVEQLTRFVLDLGMDTFVYWPRVPPEEHERQVEFFAGEVAPAVREAAAAARS